MRTTCIFLIWFVIERNRLSRFCFIWTGDHSHNDDLALVQRMMRAQRTYHHTSARAFASICAHLENEWNRQNRLNELVCYFDFVVIARRSSYLFLLIRAPEFLLIRDTLYTNNVVISTKRFSFFYSMPFSKTRTIYRETSVYV